MGRKNKYSMPGIHDLDKEVNFNFLQLRFTMKSGKIYFEISCKISRKTKISNFI